MHIGTKPFADINTRCLALADGIVVVFIAHDPTYDPFEILRVKFKMLGSFELVQEARMGYTNACDAEFMVGNRLLDHAPEEGDVLVDHLVQLVHINQVIPHSGQKLWAIWCLFHDPWVRYTNGDI